jgi:hypothetical protein
MDVPLEPGKPMRKYNPLAVASLALGLITMTFPTISFLYLVVVNGGAGYLQSIFCGIPFTFASILTGIVSLVLICSKDQPGAAQAAGKGAWMAIVGIVLGTLVLGMDCIMLAFLIIPFLSGMAG